MTTIFGMTQNTYGLPHHDSDCYIKYGAHKETIVMLRTIWDRLAARGYTADTLGDLLEAAETYAEKLH